MHTEISTIAVLKYLSITFPLDLNFRSDLPKHLHGLLTVPVVFNYCALRILSTHEGIYIDMSIALIYVNIRPPTIQVQNWLTAAPSGTRYLCRNAKKGNCWVKKKQGETGVDEVVMRWVSQYSKLIGFD